MKQGQGSVGRSTNYNQCFLMNRNGPSWTAKNSTHFVTLLLFIPDWVHDIIFATQAGSFCTFPSPACFYLCRVASILYDYQLHLAFVNSISQSGAYHNQLTTQLFIAAQPSHHLPLGAVPVGESLCSEAAPPLYPQLVPGSCCSKALRPACVLTYTVHPKNTSEIGGLSLLQVFLTTLGLVVTHFCSQITMNSFLLNHQLSM